MMVQARESLLLCATRSRVLRCCIRGVRRIRMIQMAQHVGECEVARRHAADF
jgi:hypothetical protein